MPDPSDQKRGFRRVLRTESEWSAIEWVGLAVVLGLCLYVFDLVEHHDEGLGGAMFGGACVVAGMLIGRRIKTRRTRRRITRERAGV